MNLAAFFIFIQTSLLFLMALHDWLHFPPLTNIRELEKHHSRGERAVITLLNTSFIAVALWITFTYQPLVLHNTAAFALVAIYGLLSLGTICAWWIPYVVGSSAAHKAGFVEYRNTHTFLPARGDHVVPNTLHVILHLHVWLCLGISMYLWME